LPMPQTDPLSVTAWGLVRVTSGVPLIVPLLGQFDGGSLTARPVLA
jgi:hypothetical protein